MPHKTMSVTLPKELPILHSSEILVVGGGPGGIGAAVAAAREGRRVLLVEHYGFLGGMATAGEVNPFMPNHLEGRSLDEGIFEDWLAKIRAYSGRKPGDRTIDPNAARFAAEALCTEAGVDLLYHHRAVHVETDSRRITGVVLHSKSGLSVATAEIVIDSTGDGDVAALAGCGFQCEGENGAPVQPMTACFKLKIDPRDLPADLRRTPPEGSVRDWLRDPLKEQAGLIQKVYRDARRAGKLLNRRGDVLMFGSVEPDVIHFNSTRISGRSPIDGGDLSAAEIEGRQQILELVNLLRENVPLFKHARLHSIAPQIGIRESRRINGRARVTRDDFKRGTAYPDGVVRVTYPIDIHSPKNGGTEITRLPPGAWYEIPYGCLVPNDIDNLLIGSRCISVDTAVHSSVRVMPPVCSLGQAAGTAAAMALEKGVVPPEIDGVELKERLIANGRNLVAYDPARRYTAEAAVAAAS
ncbi:MAG: FAD-dependent oxidoreductase [Kiritimatiellae bacterium]|nr:FAD-dependent oxidoreductase [Kiritimatiellia bacterium]